VVGTRRVTPAIRADVHRVLTRRLTRGRFAIVTGGADGVDALAEEFALANGLHCIVIRPQYRCETYPWPPKAAPVVRNGVIVSECDGMIAWPSAESCGGTDTAIELMEASIRAWRHDADALVILRPDAVGCPEHGGRA
jgi:hypothetical protein